MRWLAPLMIPAIACTSQASLASDGAHRAVVSWIAEADTSVTGYRDATLVGDEVWALSQSAPYLRRFDAYGRYLGASVGRGDGPLELRLPNWVVSPPEGPGSSSVAYLVHRMRELVPLDQSGTPAARRVVFVPGGGDAIMRLSRLSYGQPRLVRALTAEHLLVQYQLRAMSQTTRDIGDALLIRVDTAGRLLDTIADFREFMPDGLSERVTMFVPVPLWAVCDTNRIAVYAPKQDELRWHSPAGMLLGAIKLDLPRQAITRRDRSRYATRALEVEAQREGGRLNDLTQTVAAIVTQMGPGFASHAPHAVGLLCDIDGTAWIQRFDTEDDGRGFGDEWVGVALDGRRQRVLVPRRFEPRVVRHANMFGWISDEDDVQRIARVALPSSWQ